MKSLLLVLTPYLLLLGNVFAAEIQLARTYFPKDYQLFGNQDLYREKLIFGESLEASAFDKPTEISSVNLDLIIKSDDQKTQLNWRLYKKSNDYFTVSKDLGGIYTTKYFGESKSKPRQQDIRFYENVLEVLIYPDSNVSAVSTDYVRSRIFIGNDPNVYLLDGFRRSDESNSIIASFPPDLIWARSQKVDWKAKNGPLATECFEAVTAPEIKKAVKLAQLAIGEVQKANISDLESLVDLEKKLREVSKILVTLTDLINEIDLSQGQLLEAINSAKKACDQ